MNTPGIGDQREPVVRITYPSGVYAEFFSGIAIDSLKKLVRPTFKYPIGSSEFITSKKSSFFVCCKAQIGELEKL